MKCKLVSLGIAIAMLFTLAQGSSNALAVNEKDVSVAVDFNTHYQTIEGFGGFGVQDVWWNPVTNLYSDAWADKVVNDLGITMWRNELQPYNPVSSNTASNGLDANWDKQKNAVLGLFNKAKDSGVDLKVILTVWSPPGEFKTNVSNYSWAGDTKATRSGEKNSTKNGGTLNPDKYTDYANWIISGLDMYKEIGINVYAISLQNEPAFVEPYNSCIYTTKWYTDLLKNCVPIIKQKYPDVKIFGSEHMLNNEASDNDMNFFFHRAIMKDPEALKNLDVFAAHGYSDGVRAEAIRNHKILWENAYRYFSAPANKPYWMTETSGYSDNWASDGKTPGALDLGIAIGSSLKYGKASAWVWWQMSEFKTPKNITSMMSGTATGKMYMVSKQFYKYIRPGSVMLEAGSSDSSLLSTAFYNDKSKTFTSVLINTSDQDKKVTLTGQNVPDEYKYYITTGDANVNAEDRGMIKNGEIKIPANSIVTLVKDNNNFIIGPSVSATGIKIAPSAKTLIVGQTYTLKPVVLPSNATNKNVLYTPSNENAVSVNANGLVKAKEAGTATITIKTQDSKYKTTCKITVLQPVKSIKLSKTTIRLKNKRTAALKVRVNPYDASRPEKKFKSSNPKIAKVSSKGKITAVKKGRTTIKVTVKTKDGTVKKGTCKVIVN